LIVHEHCRDSDITTPRPTIVITAVRKGLNNQRMRIVQDILVAAMIGANVELPDMLYGRTGCHSGQLLRQLHAGGDCAYMDATKVESRLSSLHFRGKNE
jgi:hypothetical protein